MGNYSKQKEAILNVLTNTKSHPTAEWVFDEVKKQIPNISFGTVYRNLAWLVDSGGAIKIDGNFEKCRFDGNPLPHAHLVCNSCGRVMDIEISDTLTANILVEGENKASSFTLTYKGLCEVCINKKTEEVK